MAWHVVIAGGGFGGFYAARALERLLPPQSAHVTLVNDANFMLYTPLLPGAAGATLDPRHVVVPLRSQLRHTDLVIGHVDGADPAAGTLAVRRIDGEALELAYDQLIVALGSVSRTLPVPGLGEHAIGLKSLTDAIALRNQVLRCLDIAESLEDPEGRVGVPHVRVRRGRLRRRRGARRAAGLRRPGDQATTPAAPPRGCAGCWPRRASGS